MIDKSTEISARIKEIRTKKNIQQAEIAQAISLTTTAYNRIENGKTQLSVNNLFAIANALQIDVIELLNLSENKKIQNHENIVMSQFNNGTLHISISASELERLSRKKAEKNN
jgi:transcriptional regulator with XRE-family HTH domain